MLDVTSKCSILSTVEIFAFLKSENHAELFSEAKIKVRSPS